MENRINETIYWTRLSGDAWSLYAAATEKGLVFVGSAGKPYEELADWARARVPGAELVRDDDRLRPYADELRGYLSGERREFAVPLDLRGTAFQEEVWRALREIPYGETRSYSDIARRVGKPAAARAAGAAIGANPVLIAVPCHRVVGKGGTLTGYRGGLDMKTALLGLERTGSPAGEAVRHA